MNLTLVTMRAVSDADRILGVENTSLNQLEESVMNKLVIFVAATAATMVQALAFAAPSLLVTTQSPIGVTSSGETVDPLMENQGDNGEPRCQYVNADPGYPFFCLINGRPYFCQFPDHPDMQKNCFPLGIRVAPRQIRPIGPSGVQLAQ
jgi:hypothetical protein